jgi:hypothetical protein
MFYTLLCLQYKNKPEKKPSLLKCIIKKNMAALNFDLMNINIKIK